MGLLAKTNFYFKKPKIIIVTGNGSSSTTEAIFQVLSRKLKVRKILNQNFPFVSKDEILIFETKIKELNSLDFFVRNSSLPILVVTNLGEVPSSSIFFTGDKKDSEEISKFINILPKNSQLVLNFDDETLREIKKLTDFKVVTFGFGEGADFLASDIKFNHLTNFKLNYQGNTVPIWLDYLFGKEQIYSALAAISIATIFDLNLVEVSQALKGMKIS